MNPQVDTILIAGPWASAKTTFAEFCMEQLQGDGYTPVFGSDRLLFEQGVIAQITQWDSDRQSGSGPHGVLTKLDEPGKMWFQITDGTIANREHEAMIREIAQPLPPKYIRVIEYAIGPDIYILNASPMDPPFLQNGLHLLEGLHRYNVANKVTVIELLATYDKRLKRQPSRDQKTNQQAFLDFAGEGGELVRNRGLLPPNYVPFDNNGSKKVFWQKAQKIYTEHIRHALGIEHQVRGSERRSGGVEF